MGRRVDPDTAVVHVDGTRIVLRDDLVYLALNKPRGILSTMSDDRGRPCVGDLVVERGYMRRALRRRRRAGGSSTSAGSTPTPRACCC